ncbi:hypothetical protein E4T66_20490 [Sinimarinibacterium sp. CAU 1509]|uniref:zonular occludens toxin domain-containing protein n=1 Tax=Sinimarinibacterium sp. CAU 1509 TaxID=2562283 RepID=UPI0010ABFFE6|nr:zonular occludens toxin domain-containing protein [Sinimarinibacterium sp. CAU 1509]TJY55762.1 hypothetical protein E4T66_20490 [Sinimarinibacterium sp. CAU 1509]
MSIVVYAGLTGHGKSYSAVENFVIPALKDKRHVAHNLDLFVPALNVVCGHDCAPLLHQIPAQCSPAEVIEKCPEGAVIVLDEVWEYWAKGLTINEIPKDELRFFRKHRHRVGEDGIASEMCLISHSPTDDLPSFIRSIVDLTYIHEKHSAVGSKGRFRVDVYSRCQSAERPAKGKLIRKLQGKYRPEVWNCYNSHTQSKAKVLGEGGLEKMPDARGNVWKSFTMGSAMAAALLLPLLFWLAFRAVTGMASGGGLKESHAAIAAEAKRNPTIPQPTHGSSRQGAPEAHTELSRASDNLGVVVVSPPVVVEAQTFDLDSQTSRIWRVVGGIKRPDGTGIVVLVSATGRRLMPSESCEQDDLGQWSCALDDGRATLWSGAGGGGLDARQAPGVGVGSPPLQGSARAVAG